MSQARLEGLFDQQPQQQDSLNDQLWDLHLAANRLGMYDAADWLLKKLLDTSSQQ